MQFYVVCSCFLASKTMLPVILIVFLDWGSVIFLNVCHTETAAQMPKTFIPGLLKSKMKLSFVSTSRKKLSLKSS
jgi:hypothetical protein